MLRFGFSPIGDMDIGHLRVALLNYLVAQQRQERFVIRVEDTPKEATLEGKDTEMMQLMEKFALKHDEVYHQSEHLRIHQSLAIRLLEEKKAFLCTCYPNEAKAIVETKACQGDCLHADPTTLKQLQEEKHPFVIRLKASILLENQKEREVPSSNQIEDSVILHTDNTPSKHFATACDDLLNEITMVIHEEQTPEGALQRTTIKRALGYTREVPHLQLPPIQERITLKRLFEEGYLPDAILNYLLLLHYPHAPEEIFTLPDAIAWFDVADIPQTPLTFDKERLREINRAHLLQIEDKKLSTLFGFADADIGKLAKLYLKESGIETINALEVQFKPIFAPKHFDHKWQGPMRTLQACIAKAPMIHSYDAFLTYLIKESGLTQEEIETPLRLLLTGSEEGPALEAIYPYLKPYLLEVIS